MAKRCGTNRSTCGMSQGLFNPFFQNGKPWFGSGGVTAEYQSVLDRATVLGYAKPSAAQQVKQNQLVINLKAAGIWNLLDVLYVFATDGDSDFATLNWKNPSAFQCAKVNSPLLEANLGFKTNGTTNYLDTTWAPSNGVNYTLNDASIFIFNSNEYSIDDSLWDCGCNDAANTNLSSIAIRRDLVTDSSIFCVNTSSAADSIFSVPSSLNILAHAQRTNGSDQKIFHNGVEKGLQSFASSGRSTNTMHIGVRNANGVMSGFNDGRYSMFGAGASLSSLELSLYNHWNTYFTSL